MLGGACFASYDKGFGLFTISVAKVTEVFSVIKATVLLRLLLADIKHFLLPKTRLMFFLARFTVASYFCRTLPKNQWEDNEEGVWTFQEYFATILNHNIYVSADACLKDSLSLVPDVPTQMDIDGKMKSSEYFLVGFLNQMLSTLLVVPVSLT